VPVLAGTDSPAPGATYGASLHGEMELLVRAGLTPTQALMAATSAPARAFGLDDRGRIAPGLRADLLLVEGDPTADNLHTRRIVKIWKRGVEAKRLRAEG
jgi:imidazolonepropionase-like amidohydrolase